MTTRFLTIAGLFLTASVTPILADTTSGSGSQPTTKTETSDPNKVVCHRVEAIGTRLAAKRVCRTKSEWDAEQSANRQDLEHTQTQRWGQDNS